MAFSEWAKFADVARSLSLGGDLASTLDRAATVAVDVIDGCDHAGISVVHRDGGITTESATDDVVRRGDELQYEVQDGPCVQAIAEEETVTSADLAHEVRWPGWSPVAARRLGIRSMLCLQLYVSDHSIGALNLYSDFVSAFDRHDQVVATELAGHVAVAMVAAREHENLQSALIDRALIGQAQGRIMEKFGVDGSQALDVLHRMSRDREVKLAVVAAGVARNGLDGDRQD